MPRIALVAVSDLMFQPRIRAALEALDLDVRVADTSATIREALIANPVVVVLDLHDASFDPQNVIAAAKAAGARVLAFGRHTAPSTLRAAREAGADSVVARSQLAAELPALIETLIGAATEADTP